MLINNKMNVQEFIITLFEFQVNAHIQHFKTKQYSKHIALGELYSGIDGLKDRFCESYFGKYGVDLEGIPKIITIGDTLLPIEMLNFYIEKMEDFRNEMEDGYLQQIIDELLELCYITKYKLENLD